MQRLGQRARIGREPSERENAATGWAQSTGAGSWWRERHAAGQCSGRLAGHIRAVDSALPPVGCLALLQLPPIPGSRYLQTFSALCALSPVPLELSASLKKHHSFSFEQGWETVEGARKRRGVDGDWGLCVCVLGQGKGAAGSVGRGGAGGRHPRGSQQSAQTWGERKAEQRGVGRRHCCGRGGRVRG